MLALTYHRSVPAFALVRASGGNPQVATSALSMLHLGDVPEPELPAAGWMRVMPSLSGICGSDLAAIGGHASLYLDPLTSYPFVPGHEVVGVLEDGSRVVIEPALGCVVRGIEPSCPRCAEGRPGLCYNATEGPIEVGLQTGYCASTGGGWGEVLVAHPSQVHALPATLADEAAVLIEPFACCVHAALRGGASKSDVVVVGMPGDERVDWAAIWQRELTVMGAYAYGSEPKSKGRRTFELALEAAPELHLERLAAPLFSLGDYRDAIAYAMSAGRLGAVKVAFDLRGLRA